MSFGINPWQWREGYDVLTKFRGMHAIAFSPNVERNYAHIPVTRFVNRDVVFCDEKNFLAIYAVSKGEDILATRLPNRSWKILQPPFPINSPSFREDFDLYPHIKYLDTEMLYRGDYQIKINFLNAIEEISMEMPTVEYGRKFSSILFNNEEKAKQFIHRNHYDILQVRRPKTRDTVVIPKKGYITGWQKYLDRIFPMKISVEYSPENFKILKEFGGPFCEVKDTHTHLRPMLIHGVDRKNIYIYCDEKTPELLSLLLNVSKQKHFSSAIMQIF
jgi:hypothetical protein